jgi:hypothetical protein
LTPRRIPLKAPPRGFPVVERRQDETFSLIRLRSNAPRPVRIAGLRRRTLDDPSALVVVKRALSYEGDLAPSRSSDSATASAASARSQHRAVL